MKNISLLIILLLMVCQCFSQEFKKIDDVKYLCKYLLNYQPDSTDKGYLEDEVMFLFIENGVSKFISEGTYLKDSIIRSLNNSQASNLNLMAVMGNVPKSKFNEKIFKNYPNGKISVTEKFVKDYLKYEESINLFNWNINNETKQIANYTCQKAITKFAGREYIAWFTNDISLSEGPYKFRGLPGLIISIYDTKNHYKYDLLNIKKYSDEKKIMPENKTYISTSKEKFYLHKKEYFKNMFQQFEQAGASITFDDPRAKKRIQEKINKRNNPIELIYNN